MDMSEGCGQCMQATDRNVSHCMTDFADVKCTPCDVNLLRHMNECRMAGLGTMCAMDDLLHVSDQCAACLVVNGMRQAVDCMPDPVPGQCLIEDYPGYDAVSLCPADDGTDAGTAARQACMQQATTMLSDVRAA